MLVVHPLGPFFSFALCVFVCRVKNDLEKTPLSLEAVKTHLTCFGEWKICWKRPPCFIELQRNVLEWALHWLVFCANVCVDAHSLDTPFIVAVVAVVAMTFFCEFEFIDIILLGHHADP